MWTRPLSVPRDAESGDEFVSEKRESNECHVASLSQGRAGTAARQGRSLGS